MQAGVLVTWPHVSLFLSWIVATWNAASYKRKYNCIATYIVTPLVLATAYSYIV